MDKIMEILKNRTLLLDGAMATYLKSHGLTAEDFGGKMYDGCYEYLNLVKPKIIEKVYTEYLEAGADIIETNTFQGSSIGLMKYGLSNRDIEINMVSARIGREIVDKFYTKEKPRFLAGAIGPPHKNTSGFKDITAIKLEESYYRQAKALFEGGVDLFLIETMFDTLNARTALNAVRRLQEEVGKDIPVFLSTMVKKGGVVVNAKEVEEFYNSVKEFGLLGIGVNCGFGPDFMDDYLDYFCNIVDTNVICYPSAGLPNDKGKYPMEPKTFSKKIQTLTRNPKINIIGGCCGTTPKHIKELDNVLEENLLFEAVRKGKVIAINKLLAKFKKEKIYDMLISSFQTLCKMDLMVSELLKSAEVVNRGIEHLGLRSDKPKIVIGTVEGDVHDSGKNILHILLKNCGFEIIDLGVDVKEQDFIQACENHVPVVVCISGLLIKAAEKLVEVVRIFEEYGINTPIIVGGASLTERFAMEKIKPIYSGIVAYSKNAINGVSIVNEIMTGTFKNRELGSDLIIEKKSVNGSSNVRDYGGRVAPDTSRHVLEGDIQEIFEYINPQMLFGVHLGFKGLFTKKLQQDDEKAKWLNDEVNAVKKAIVENKLFTPMALYQFFEVTKDNRRLFVGGEVLEFERQKEGEFLCVTDFVSKTDSIGLFVTTCGKGIINHTSRLRNKGEYLKSHIFQILAIESAEAFAEVTHKKMRALWGMDENLEKGDYFQAKYQGIRLSFGYPACPNLDDQAKLFRLIDPGAIGVTLTSVMMMDPEASVSAMVFHHKEAKYFNIQT